MERSTGLLLLGGGALLGYWLYTRKSEPSTTSSPSTPKELEPPLTGIRWYTMTLESTGIKAVSPGTPVASTKTTPYAKGDEVFFAVEHAPTNARRIVKATVDEVGVNKGVEAMFATVTEDVAPLSVETPEGTPVGLQFLVRRVDLLDPSLAKSAGGMLVAQGAGMA